MQVTVSALVPNHNSKHKRVKNLIIIAEDKNITGRKKLDVRVTAGAGAGRGAEAKGQGRGYCAGELYDDADDNLLRTQK